MKTALAISSILIAFILTGCTPIAEIIADEIFIDYPYLEEPLNIVWKRADAFVYVAESSGASYWKSPREMDADGGGDCEDFAGWMVYHLGNDASLIRFKPANKNEYHAIVHYQGTYIEPQKYSLYYTYKYIYQSSDVEEISYDAVMKLSTAFYTK